MKRVISFVLVFVLSVPAYAGNVISNETVEYLGGFPGIEVKGSITGRLAISNETIAFQPRSGDSKAFSIKSDSVIELSGDEYAKRRVKSAIAWTVLVTPVALFALFGKKKREMLAIEFNQMDDSTGATEKHLVVFRYKQKGGRAFAIEKAVESATGKKIIKEKGRDKESAQE